MVLNTHQHNFIMEVYRELLEALFLPSHATSTPHPYSGLICCRLYITWFIFFCHLLHVQLWNETIRATFHIHSTGLCLLQTMRLRGLWRMDFQLRKRLPDSCRRLKWLLLLNNYTWRQDWLTLLHMVLVVCLYACLCIVNVSIAIVIFMSCRTWMSYLIVSNPHKL